jgi:ribonuclease HII
MDNSRLFVAGVDEAGRGPLAGPVVAAAVILDSASSVSGLRDSKQLSAHARRRLARIIRQRARAWAIAHATVAEIDALNILQASLLAMERAVSNLLLEPTLVLVDGNRAPSLACQTRAIVKGDVTVPAISAASIVAKVFRDSVMSKLDRKYPVYGFAQHKGYGTSQHIDALRVHGACAVHRRSFRPVRAVLARTSSVSGA